MLRLPPPTFKNLCDMADTSVKHPAQGIVVPITIISQLASFKHLKSDATWYCKGAPIEVERNRHWMF